MQVRILLPEMGIRREDASGMQYSYVKYLCVSENTPPIPSQPIQEPLQREVDRLMDSERVHRAIREDMEALVEKVLG